MSMPTPQLEIVNRWLQENVGDHIVSASTVTGGSISNAYLIETESKRRYFAKTLASNRSGQQDDLYAAEASGLEALTAATTLTVPKVLAFEQGFILMTFIDAKAQAGDYWQRLAQGLSELHRTEVPGFGFERDNYCGDTLQKNPSCSDGHEFFSQHRLLFQAGLAFDKGLLEAGDLKSVESLCLRLRSLIPPQPASLIHGDLWSGNVITDSRGLPALIDPACYWGWAEAEIAMTQLFGGFNSGFYRAYNEENPLQSGWQDRMDLYNLYHLLNHLNIFGGSYLAQVRQTIKRYQ